MAPPLGLYLRQSVTSQLGLRNKKKVNTDESDSAAEGFLNYMTLA